MHIHSEKSHSDALIPKAKNFPKYDGIEVENNKWVSMEKEHYSNPQRAETKRTPGIYSVFIKIKYTDATPPPPPTFSKKRQNR